MGNPNRTYDDIKLLRILPHTLKNGWVVEMLYTDEKAVTFSVDYGDKVNDMLDMCIEQVRVQLHG